MLGPENTLEVFQSTINLGVLPWLETDAWETSDGVLVLHHDLDLCRTTNIATFPGYDCVVAANNPLGRFPWIRDFTLAELKTLDVGSWFSPAFVGVTMPTLEEAINLVDGTGVRLLVEIKGLGQAPIIEEILTRTGLSADNLIIWARQPFAYDDFHGVIPGIRQVSGLLALASVTDVFLAERAAAGDFGIAIQAVGLTQAVVDQIHSYGLYIYTLPGAFGGDPVIQQIPLGVDAVTSFEEDTWAAFLPTVPCVDRVDNDSDGFADFYGIDFDFDGIHEIPPDPACIAQLDLTEVAECQDGIDNDMDGFIDLVDPECTMPNSLSETLFIPYCGDSIITPPETCDDGNVQPGDGCYSTCLLEDSTAIVGTAVGGSVTVTVSGVMVVVTTNSGELAAQVVANLETAVNIDPGLQGLGITATAIVSSLFTDGTIDSVIIADAGLTLIPPPPPVPGLAPLGWLALAFSLACFGAMGAKRQRPQPDSLHS